MTGSPFIPLNGVTAHETRVYCTSYEAIAHLEPDAEALLSAEEIGRANRFVFEPDRSRFILAHAYLRRVVELNTALPATTPLLLTAAGRPPELAPGENVPPVHISLSHCRSHVAVAISERQCVGVDVETISPDHGGHGIAEHFFAFAERQFLSNLRPDQFDKGFIRLWTAKEAFSKAIGLGLALPLDRIIVQDDGRQAQIGFASYDILRAFQVAHFDIEDTCICAAVSVGHDVVKTILAAHEAQ